MRKVFEILFIVLLVFVFGAIIAGAVADEIKQSSKRHNKKEQCVSPIIVIDGTDWNIAVEYLKEYEVFAATSYTIDGYDYIGYGHLINSNEQYDTLSEKQATELLEKDLKHLVTYASKITHLQGTEALSLGLLFYNVSHKSILNSGLLEEIKNPRYLWDRDKIERLWLSLSNFRGAQHPGLLQRRQFELDLFFSYETRRLGR